MGVGRASGKDRYSGTAFLAFHGRDQGDHRPINQDLPGILEIDGDAFPDYRLYLAEAPVRAARVPYQFARYEKLRHAAPR